MFPSREKFKMVEWTPELDLAEFYAEAHKRGFENNASQKMLVDSLKNETRYCVWILYYDNKPVGSVAAHSLDVLGNNAYRICTRTCVFTDQIPILHVRTRKKTIQEHQNVTAQLFIPTCIEWAGIKNDLYISTNESQVASQRLVHKIYCPALMETGAITSATNLHYRGHEQTFWKLDPKVFLTQLSEHGKW